MHTATLPVAVIGAGPVGLAAMAHLLAAGEEAVLFEAGHQAGAAVSEWAHVRLFTRWEHNLDPAAAALLRSHGWVPPDPHEYPTGGELVDRYLVPLADLPVLAAHIHLATPVVSVTRAGLDKLKSTGRREAPFVLRVVDAGDERDVTAKAVIDASGTWYTPNPLGAGGVRAIGETGASPRIRYGLPDVLGADRHRYAGGRVLVVGSGQSAFHNLIDLAELAKDEPGTEIHWAVRRETLEEILGRGGPDALPERARLATRVAALVSAGALRSHTGLRIDRLGATGSGVNVFAGGQVAVEVDEIVAATGFRPDRSLLGELRLSLDAALESPAALAPLIDPNKHSCGTVPPHGAEQLAHPEEPGMFIVGMKSYGRAPTALMMTAYAQVRSVVAAVGGDWDAARDVRGTMIGPSECNVAAPRLGGCEQSA